ncbi:flagellar basal body-associated protein FliL [Ketobacter sp. MCCC 1A13808]|uniref:flagellar basal body-associated FliL family protein n=1 Tax=Ketobacter sp. MCCC 1A13808 TaxID=2602738 RepID=UPI000F17ED0C|nr:flagellar basal body-associated FliL family protein [Ketobacter sp. MCCC 1A13808]MVF13291.1 flagellar basal body-associated protein FliL [Ketobacter sp. MCCC 1A13808]RLP54280.1 MAG: flagellar basal body-associated protein FliL [Ketobacter sp.]
MRSVLRALTCLILIVSSYSHANTETPAEASKLYIELSPSFVTNYQAQRMGYLKADVTLMVNDQKTMDAITEHMPSIRNNLVMLFSRQDENVLSSTEGKTHLREEALREVLSALESEGAPAAVEDVLFTSFLID